MHIYREYVRHNIYSSQPSRHRYLFIKSSPRNRTERKTELSERNAKSSVIIVIYLIEHLRLESGLVNGTNAADDDDDVVCCYGDDLAETQSSDTRPLAAISQENNSPLSEHISALLAITIVATGEKEKKLVCNNSNNRQREDSHVGDASSSKTNQEKLAIIS